MSKKINKDIRKFILKNIEYYKSDSGRIQWVELMREVKAQFPHEILTFDRVRSIYRSSSEEQLEKAKRGEDGDPTIPHTDNQVPDDKEEVGTIKRAGDKLETNIQTNVNPANLSPDEIVDLFKLDKKKWELVGFTAKSWNSSVRDYDNENRKITNVVRNYSVKARFKIRANSAYVDQKVIDEIFNYANKLYTENFSGTPIKREAIAQTGNTLVMGAFDVHIGKLAWKEETGENYDLKIATNRFLTVVKNIVDKAKALGIDNIIFPVGNDFFQFDNDIPTTTKDTPVDTDIRWQKLFQRGVSLLRTTIDYCATFSKVDVIWVPGNHDFKASFYAFETLRGYYDQDPRVHIDHDIKSRTYRLIGPNLLGFTHGDKEKSKRLHALMSVEVPELWGQSKYREWIVGHFHKGGLAEDMGVTVRVLGSITGTDAWHYQKGFVGSLRAAQGLIYNDKIIGPNLIIYESINIDDEPQQK